MYWSLSWVTVTRNIQVNIKDTVMGSFLTSLHIQLVLLTSENFPVVGDLIRDDQWDLLIASFASHTFSILLRKDTAYFKNFIVIFTIYALDSSSLAINDFNRDGRMNIGVSNFASHNLYTYLGYSNETFLIESNFSTGSESQPHPSAIKSFNNNVRSDFVVANTVTRYVGVFLVFHIVLYMTRKFVVVYSTSEESIQYVHCCLWYE